MRALAVLASLVLLAPLGSAQQHARTEREVQHRAPTYGEAEIVEIETVREGPRRTAPTYGQARTGERTLVQSERVVTRYYDGGEARQYVERQREPAPRWIRDEARAFRSAPQTRTARRAPLDGVSYGDGSRYRGDMVRGLPQGQGSMQYGDGSAYSGDFRNGVPHGQGTYETASGDVLTGTFRDGVLMRGEVSYAAGHRYEGAFVDGRPQGQGTIDYADGSSYQGTFQSGRPDGWGTFRDADGERFEGSWNRGRMDDGYGDRGASSSDERRRSIHERVVDRRRAERRAQRRGRGGVWR